MENNLKTAEEILADAHGILPQYLNVHCGKITTERNIEAMQAYARHVAEAVRYECIIMAQRVHGTGPSFPIDAFKSIIVDQFIK